MSDRPLRHMTVAELMAPQWFCAKCLCPYPYSYRAYGATCLNCGQECKCVPGERYWFHISELAGRPVKVEP